MFTSAVEMLFFENNQREHCAAVAMFIKVTVTTKQPH